MTKIGRNQPCPCGSGKKYKKCHGSPIFHEVHKKAMEAAITQSRVQQLQRERQQGLAKPIMSAELSKHRVVLVKNRLMYSEKWKTFHDFLVDYLKEAMGVSWGNAELAKPIEDRHPILIWYNYVCEHQHKYIKIPGKVHSSPMTGADAAYLHLAYDLYALENNAELQQKLIARLRDTNNFEGARYEVYVAATLIRAGFSIEFENEDDRTTTHCEFTATFTQTRKRFSVEAKHCSDNSFRIGRQLNRALSKQANHTRIVFIDININDDTHNDEILRRLDSARLRLRTFEGRIVNGKPLPSAYIFITNNPWHHHLEDEQIRRSALAEGFQIADFKGDATFPNIRARIEARERHIEMEHLMRSMKEHFEIPATFDGSIPEFAFGDNSSRLLIGQQYLVKDETNADILGVLTSGTVLEPERAAYCIFACQDGKSRIIKYPLSDSELAVWQRYPDTFFGEVGQRSTNTDDPAELYDLIYGTYSKTPRDLLLEFMREALDFDKLRDLDQPFLS